MEDKKIIEGCKQKNEAAFKALVYKYSNVLMGICIRYLRNKNDAQDALQDTFIKIYTNIHSYNDTGSFQAWMAKITVNVCLKNIRSNKSTIDIEEARVEESNCISIIEEMNAKEILLLMDNLPELQRVDFNLFVIEGYNQAEIGDLLNLTESSSRVYLMRARQKMQELTNTITLKIINS